MFKKLLYRKKNRKKKYSFDSCVVCYYPIPKGECFYSNKCEKEALKNPSLIDYEINWK